MPIAPSLSSTLTNLSALANKHKYHPIAIISPEECPCNTVMIIAIGKFEEQLSSSAPVIVERFWLLEKVGELKKALS